MTQKQSQSRRSRRAEYQNQKQRQRTLTIGFVLVGIIVVAGLLFWTRQISTAAANRGIVAPEVAQEPANADGKSWGPADAPVLIEEYSDFQCPYCGQFATSTGVQILETYGDTGQVRFEYNHFPFLGAESVRAAQAAECANEQGAFWQYHDYLFHNQKGENQGAFSDRMLNTFATNLGLDEDAFSTCLASGKYEEMVQAQREEAIAREVNSTPTFFVNGEMVTGALPFDQFQTIIENALAGR